MPLELLGERPAPDDVAAALETESTRAALALLAELPEDQAEVIALRVLAGLDVAAVARILSRRPGTVRGLVIGGCAGSPCGWSRLGWHEQ